MIIRIVKKSFMKYQDKHQKGEQEDFFIGGISKNRLD